MKSFTYTLPDGTSVSLDVDAVAGSTDSGVLSEDMSDLLTALGEAAHDRNSGVLIRDSRIRLARHEQACRSPILDCASARICSISLERNVIQVAQPGSYGKELATLRLAKGGWQVCARLAAS